MSPGENSSASMCSNMFLSHLCKNASEVGLVLKILQPVFHRGGSVEAWEILNFVRSILRASEFIMPPQ